MPNDKSFSYIREYKVGGMIFERCKVNKVWIGLAKHSRIPVTVFLFFVVACKESPQGRQVTSGFYYWKSRLTISEKEAETLTQLKTASLYIKLFDVDWNEELQSPQPIAKLAFDSVAVQQLLQQHIHLIPVVFITNESLLKIDSVKSIDKASIQYPKDIRKNKYYASFVKEYSKTSFYKEAFNSCVYLKDYIKEN